MHTGREASLRTRGNVGILENHVFFFDDDQAWSVGRLANSADHFHVTCAYEIVVPTRLHEYEDCMLTYSIV